VKWRRAAKWRRAEKRWRARQQRQPTWLPPHLHELVARASLTEQPLGVVDEAQMMAYGPGALPRPPGPTFDGPYVPDDVPAGPEVVEVLRDALTLILGDSEPPFLWTQVPEGRGDSPWLVRHIYPLRSRAVALIERMDFDPACPHGPLPITISVAPLMAVVNELVSLAYRPPASRAERLGGPGTITFLIGPDRKATAVPTRLVHRWDAPTGILVGFYYSLFGRRTERDWVARAQAVSPMLKPDRYRGYLLRRLLARTLLERHDLGRPVTPDELDQAYFRRPRPR
jgi:hypothetical protein